MDGTSALRSMIISADDPETFAEAMEIKAALDQELEEEVEAELEADLEDTLEGEEADDVPNTIFVPLKTIEPEVDAREFTIYVIMLIVFMYNVMTQDFSGDFLAVQGLQSMVDQLQFDKIKTAEDYEMWWVDLKAGLETWELNTVSAQTAGVNSIEHTAWAQDSGQPTAAVLVGVPFVSQVRCASPNSCVKLRRSFWQASSQPEPITGPNPVWYSPPEEGAGGSSNSSTAPPEPTRKPQWRASSWKGDFWMAMKWDAIAPFNNTDGSPCRWPLDPVSQACYTQTRLDIDGELGYVVPNMHKILDGTYDWSPANWLGPSTIQVGHQFTVFIPSTRRFAVGTMSITFDDTGGVRTRARFETHEPFLLSMSPTDFYIEMAFYGVIVYMFLKELVEIWDCICQSELIIPLQIVSLSLYLSVLEIHYFHERSAEVYDPRNPKTGKPFEFPDQEELERHVKTTIAEKRNVIVQHRAKMDSLKRRMADAPIHHEKSTEYLAFHDEMRDLHLQLIQAELALRDEVVLNETACTLQLAAMWANKWESDFDPGYLSALSNSTVKNLEFKDVDWLQTARDFISWGKSYSDDLEVKSGVGDIVGAMAGAAKALPAQTLQTAANLSKIFSNTKEVLEQRTPQERLFHKLGSFVNFLDVIRDTIKLHERMTVARNIEPWNGPRGVQLSNTIERAYQKPVQTYNKTGRELVGLQTTFPQEVQEGFSSRNQIKADTVKTMAQAVQTDLNTLLEVAGMLGFFFPGSPMWETRRKLREQHKYNHSDGFWTSFENADWGVVSATSMGMYMGGVYRDIKGNSAVSTDAEATTDNPTFEDEGSSQGDSPALSGSSADQWQAHQKLDDDRVQVLVGNVSPGTPGWRKLVTKPMSLRVNYEGQFIVHSRKNSKLLKYTKLYPLYLWLRAGLRTYMTDFWNVAEMASYLCFIVAFVFKIKMNIEEAPQIQTVYDNLLSMNTESIHRTSSDVSEQDMVRTEDELAGHIEMFQLYTYYYMITLVPNSMLMWFKLFKYFNVIPQMGMLIKVLGSASGPVLIFTTVSLVPCFGIALSYHVAYGQLLPNYSTIPISLNTVLRMSVGDFNFQEIFKLGPVLAVVLFWVTALLLVFTLINIFVAIILKSYEHVLAENPDANDSSQFMAMVFMQAKKTAVSSLSAEERDAEREDAQPHVISQHVEHIEKDKYWDIFDQYWSLSSQTADVEVVRSRKSPRFSSTTSTPTTPPNRATRTSSGATRTSSGLRITVPASPTDSGSDAYATTAMLQNTNARMDDLAAQVQHVKEQTNTVLAILRRMEAHQKSVKTFGNARY